MVGKAVNSINGKERKVMHFEISWSPVSARFAHSIARFALANGVDSSDTEHVAAKVLAEVKRDVKANGKKKVVVEKKSGEEVEKEVKRHELRQRATGARLLKLTLDAKEEWYLEECSGLTQALVRIDQAMAGMESQGAGIDWMPPVGGVLERHLLTACSAVKASMDAAREAKAKEVGILTLPAVNGAV